MQTATGRVRYNPINSLARNGDWLILECDDDWHHWYAKDAQQRMPGSWRQVVDADRFFTREYEGRPRQPVLRRYEKYGKAYTEQTDEVAARDFVDYTPHIALLRPKFVMPMWGAHISVLRSETPTKNTRLWQQQTQLGKLEFRIRTLRRQNQELREKIEAYTATLVPGLPPQEISRGQSVVRQLQQEFRNTLNRIRTLESEARPFRGQPGLPPIFAEGSEIEFQFNPEMYLARTHWCLSVRCPWVAEVRQFYGLPAKCPVPLHLTVGVTEG